jgi:serine/threonine-protein kinase
MAEIYLARQWGEGGFFKDVVIKRLFRHLAEHQKALSMFQYEARLLAELSHPNIPQVYELGYEEGTWFLAMEFVEGATVADLWRGGSRVRQRMPLPVAAGVVLQACEALHHAHECRDRAGRPLRIVHRDVTPHNTMLTRDGIAKVMDFGVAQTAARRDTEHGAVKGTFSYMAPEQVRARPLDKRADVFALGVILYELTTGARLYRGNDVQVMTAIVEQDAPPPSTLIPDYPADLEEIVMAALQRNRGARLPSAAHMALALEDFAVRNGVTIGPRAIAQYYRLVFPYEREPEEDLAMVHGDDSVPEDDSGEWSRPSTDNDAYGEIDESGIMRDLELLDPEPDDTGVQAIPAGGRATEPSPQTLPPEALEELLFDDVTHEGDTDQGEAEPLSGFDEEGDRPVVLLESPKSKPERDRDFVDDLARRLESDDDDH